MKLSFKRAVIYFAWAYLIVTILAYGISFIAGIVFKLPSYQDLGLTLFEDPAFVMMVPYHLLINLLVWTLFSYLYLRKSKQNVLLLKESFNLGCLWLAMALAVDCICFVLIKSPVSLTPHQFYIEYQPWISITYVLLFISPLLSYMLVNRQRLKTARQ